MLKKIIAVLSVLIFISLLVSAYPRNVNACSCVAPPQPETSFENAAAVFSGKVIDIRRDNELNGYSPKKVYFEVTKTWKGIDETQVVIRTGLGGGDCGVTFEVGKEYMVYASKSNMYGEYSLVTTICTNTGLLSAAKADLDFLDEGEAPTEKVNIMEEENSWAPYIWGGSAVLAVIIVIIGIVFYRKKR